MVEKNHKMKSTDNVISPNKCYLLNLDEVDEDEPCRVCRDDVSIDTDGMQCDRCNGWVHSHEKCSELTKTQFKFMKKCKIPAIQYICLKCRDVSPDNLDPRDAVARDAIAKNAA